MDTTATATRRRTRRPSPQALAFQLEAATNDAARALNAAYSLNRKARTTGDTALVWSADTALKCARRDVQALADLAGTTYEVALKDAEAVRPNVGCLTLPVR